MSNAIFRVSDPINEEVRSYLPHSEEIQKLMLTYRKMYAAQVDVPLYIGDKEVRTQKTLSIHPPHDHHHCLGKYHLAGEEGWIWPLKLSWRQGKSGLVFHGRSGLQYF